MYVVGYTKSEINPSMVTRLDSGKRYVKSLLRAEIVAANIAEKSAL